MSAPCSGQPQPGHPTAIITSADGLDLALWHLGGDGTPVLLAHATGFAGGLWQPVVAHLSKRASCWAVDFRGHGHSPAKPDDMVWTRVAEDAIAAAEYIVEATGTPVGAAGHSMGGAAVLAAAARRPELFAAIWAYEPIIFPPAEELGFPPGADLPDPEDNPLAVGALRRRSTFDSRIAARTNFSTKAPLNVFSATAMEAYLTWGFAPADLGSDAADGAITLRCTPEVESRTYVEGSRHSFWTEVPTIDRPVTVAQGRVETFTPSGFAGHIARHIPGAVLEPHPDLGHFGPMQVPDAIAASIAAAVLPA
jgi:pimeloyl-ACP methyl ester carboxylesterase